MQEFRLAATSDKIWNIPELIEFLTANQHKSIVIHIDPEAVNLTQIGFYRYLDCFVFKNVTIWTHNPFEYHSKYTICRYKIDLWLEFNETIPVQYHRWTGSKIFYCLFGRPTASRLGIAAHMFSKHRNISHLHFATTTDPDSLLNFELDKLLEYRYQSIESAGTLINSLPLLLSSSKNYNVANGYDYSDPLTAYYQDILIDIVVESHVVGPTFLPTEKTMRPIYLKKPFIIFGSRNYLEYMRQLGFKTFCDHWDESYDGYEAGERLTRILDLIDTIATKTPQELHELYKEIQPIINHNYQLAITGNYNLTIQEICHGE
jgi:hypothetical protein